ncbi:MAG: sigma-70 family RNA polymerase sigma factor [Phenylobacterium sp.]|uniref:ECF-type sigma factor n=1 Tax=Phenylobacterium sp. TaxID=1871053 RepID=UPI0012004C06|nr:ECF-type sigma factor [Phenylobacterium sp.]TAJ71962.1 MAG: sigma-70 family RNA polymerase sigma factor [Phenylobacterium sp.]
MGIMTVIQPSSAFAGREPRAPQLLAQHYDELRRIARRIICTDAQRHALQATELVNETILRLIRSGLESVDQREHLLALASRTMRRVLIDEARRALAAKRRQPALLTRWPGGPATGVNVEALDDAIAALERFSPEHSRIVELRFGLGLSVEETARTTGIAERTVKRRWQAARTWLHNYLTQDELSAVG